MKPIIAFLMLAGFALAEDPQTPGDNAEPSAAQVALGRALFFDPRLSTTGQVSCATCHKPEKGYTDDGPVSVGVNNQRGTRRAQTVLNAVYKQALFHDGRAAFLEGQVTQPLQAPAEMGNQTLGEAFGRIARIPGYQQLFLEAFGHTVNVSEGIKACAAFERTLVSSEAPIDRFIKGETWALDARQQHGVQVFYSSGCANCHSGEQFTDQQFHDILGRTRDRNGTLDTGRGKISRNNQDNFKFVTPTLRDIGRRAPYGHAGQFATMDDMVAYLRNPVNGVEINAHRWSDRDAADLAYALNTVWESYDYPLVTAPSLPR